MQRNRRAELLAQIARAENSLPPYLRKLALQNPWYGRDKELALKHFDEIVNPEEYALPPKKCRNCGGWAYFKPTVGAYVCPECRLDTIVDDSDDESAGNSGSVQRARLGGGPAGCEESKGDR